MKIKMKTIELAIVAFVLINFDPFNLNAQTTPQPETLLGNKKISKNVGFMLAPTFGLTSMDGSAASLFSLRGGAVFNDKLTVGGFYSLSLNQIQPKSEIIPNIYMDYRAAGGFVEYTAFSNKLLHLTFPLFIGGGEVEMDNDNGSDLELGERNFFLIEPTVMAELNLHKHVRLNLGTGYRFVGNMNYRNMNQADISGVVGFMGLKFGFF
jgi:hypothetical protein